MTEIGQITWLFPIIFMIHDFEEIILIKQWKKNQFYKSLKYKPYLDFTSTASFSIAVAQEFIIFSTVTLITNLTDGYFLWFGLFAAIIIHFFIHCLISIKIKKYHPGLITAVIFLPMGVYYLFRSALLLNFSLITILLLSLIGVILLLGNLKLLHRSMPWFEELIKLI